MRENANPKPKLSHNEIPAIVLLWAIFGAIGVGLLLYTTPGPDSIPTPPAYLLSPSIRYLLIGAFGAIFGFICLLFCGLLGVMAAIGSR